MLEPPTQRRGIQILARLACELLLAAAVLLYFLVTCVPDALHKRDMMVGACVVAVIGALLFSLSRVRPVVRLVGAVLFAGASLWGVTCAFGFGW